MNGKPATILIVDDMNTSALEKMLGADGYRVLSADNGPAALARLQDERVDLILLDIVMPGMDGFEVLERIRERHGDQLPVLLTSGRYTDSMDAARALNVGANDYLYKPFDYSEVKARIVAKLLQRDLEQDLRAARQEAEAQSDLLRRVLDLVRRATSSLDPDTLAATVHHHLARDLEVEGGTVWRPDAAGEPQAAGPDAPPLPPDAWESLQAGAPLVREDNRLLLPIRLESGIGALDVTWNREWPDGATTILKALADSLAILFQNAGYVRQIARENTFHELLNQLASRGATLDEMMHELGLFLRSRLLLVNRWFHRLAGEAVTEMVEENQIHPHIVQYYRLHGYLDDLLNQRRPVLVEAREGQPFHRLFPIVAGGEVTALLVVLPPDDEASTLPPDKELVRAARFLAAELQRRREVDLRGRQLRAEFLNDFFAGSLIEEMGRAELFLRANALGLNLAHPAFVVQMQLPNFDELVEWDQPLFEKRVDELLTPLLREAQAAREALQVEGIEVTIGKGVVVVLSMPNPANEGLARQTGQNWAQKVLLSYSRRSAPNTPPPAIGFGRLVTDWHDLPQSFREAGRALRWVLSNARANVAYYGDLGSERLLAAVSDRNELTRFRDEQLLPLINYDAEREGELVRTLEIFFAHGGQLSSAAKELSIHANTLKYRLDQVAQLAGRDPRDPDVALDLQLALKIHRMF